MFVITAISVNGPEEPLAPAETYRARSLGGAMSGTDIITASGPLRWVLYDVDFESGSVRWEQTLHTAVPSEAVPDTCPVRPLGREPWRQ